MLDYTKSDSKTPNQDPSLLHLYFKNMFGKRNPFNPGPADDLKDVDSLAKNADTGKSLLCANLAAYDVRDANLRGLQAGFINATRPGAKTGHTQAWIINDGSESGKPKGSVTVTNTDATRPADTVAPEQTQFQNFTSFANTVLDRQDDEFKPVAKGELGKIQWRFRTQDGTTIQPGATQDDPGMKQADYLQGIVQPKQASWATRVADYLGKLTGLNQ